MKKLLTTLLFYGMLMLFVNALCAQSTTKTFTRTVEKAFEDKKIKHLSINAERGIIRINSWDKNETSVKIKLVSKNVNAEVAREELSYMRCKVIETNSVLRLRSHLLLPDNKKVESISSVIRVEYEIFVPKDIDIFIDNKFGSVSVQNINGFLEIILQYCDLEITQCSGELRTILSVGDFSFSESEMKGIIETRYANLDFRKLFGKIHINTNSGRLYMISHSREFMPIVDANATDVTFENRNCLPLNISVKGSYCPLKINEECYITKPSILINDYQGGSDQKAWELNYLPTDGAPKLKFNVRFGSLNLF